MTEFLLFTLYAPLASWGDIAVGEARGSWDRPSRSAVLGLVAASLGLMREQQADHDALDTGYGVAVRLDAPGTPMTDYHTVQTVSDAIVKRDRPATRAALLAGGERQTMLSQRAYLQDAVATVAIWANVGARWPLSILASALERPAFHLYAGRKANVFGLPLGPCVASSPTLADALATRPATPPELGIGRALEPRSGWGREVAYDACEGFASGLAPQRRVTRRDGMAQRSRWQFAERVVLLGVLESVPRNEGPTNS